ncbi:hypothetical protein D3C80_476120 [compost metagenome]
MSIPRQNKGENDYCVTRGAQLTWCLARLTAAALRALVGIEWCECSCCVEVVGLVELEWSQDLLVWGLAAGIGVRFF